MQLPMQLNSCNGFRLKSSSPRFNYSITIPFFAFGGNKGQNFIEWDVEVVALPKTENRADARVTEDAVVVDAIV
jgi:hypothetical protein